MMLRPFVALDVGATKVACAVGLPREDGLGAALLGTSLIAYPALPEGWLPDPLLVSRTIEQAIEATGVSAEFDQALVAYSHPALASETVRSAVTLADEPVSVRARDLERLMRRAVDHAVGIDRDTLLIEPIGWAGNGFDKVADPRGLPAMKLQGTFLLATVPLAAQRTIIQVVESAGLDVARSTLALQALAASALAQELREFLVIDLGGLHIDVGLVSERRLTALRTLSWGGMSVALSVAGACRLSRERALTVSLEGLSSPTPQVREALEARLPSLKQAIHDLLTDRPLPPAILMTGRGSLIDGVVEWVERATEIKTSLCHPTGVNQTADLSHRIGLAAALGMLDLACPRTRRPVSRSSRALARLLDRTKTILTEYF